MSRAPVPELREVRRGDDGDVIEFILGNGTVLLAHAHGVHGDEQRRTRERLLKLLSEALGHTPSRPVR